MLFICMPSVYHQWKLFIDFFHQKVITLFLSLTILGLLFVQADTLDEYVTFHNLMASFPFVIVTNYIVKIQSKEAVNNKDGFCNNSIYLLVLGLPKNVDKLFFVAHDSEHAKLCKFCYF